ncbi:MAG: hydrogenase maturation protease [Solirubrobacterales bacterium]
MSPRRVLIGLGNDLRGDDAAGLLVARAAREASRGGVDVVEAGGEPIDLLDAWENAEAAVVVDAVVSGAAPGAIQRIDAAAGPLPAPFAAPSTHALGLAEAVELARALGRLPDRLIVFGIEGTDFATGGEPSAAIRSAVASLAAAALAELDDG